MNTALPMEDAGMPHLPSGRAQGAPAGAPHAPHGHGWGTELHSASCLHCQQLIKISLLLAKSANINIVFLFLTKGMYQEKSILNTFVTRNIHCISV